MYKTEVIGRLLQTLPEFYGIIFCQTKMEVAELADVLTQRGFPCDSLHGDKSQQEREATLKKFKRGDVKVIVATDVAARGLDVKDLTHVINHSLPWDPESYVHRIGRTGRNGSKGIAITLVNPEQLNQLRRIMQVNKAVLTKGVVPSADEVAGLKIKDVLDRVSTMNLETPELILANDLIVDLIHAGDIDFKELSKEEMLARFIVAYFPKVFVKKDVMLDYMGDRIPRELLPRDPNDNRFTGGRSGGGDRGDRGPRRSYGNGGGGGGYRRGDANGGYGAGGGNSGGGYRRDDRGPAPTPTPRAERAERPAYASDTRPTPSPRASASSERPAAPRGERAYVPRAERAERPLAAAPSGERSERASSERRDAPGIKRFRGPKKTYRD